MTSENDARLSALLRFNDWRASQICVQQHGRRMKRTMSITNRTEKPRPIYVEPEGADYWMLPGQTFELRTENAVDPSAQFEIWENGDCLQVWPSNGMGFISVFAEGRELECGHQRPQAMQSRCDFNTN